MADFLDLLLLLSLLFVFLFDLIFLLNDRGSNFFFYLVLWYFSWLIDSNVVLFQLDIVSID
jgi:hypothetical protein